MANLFDEMNKGQMQCFPNEVNKLSTISNIRYDGEDSMDQASRPPVREVVILSFRDLPTNHTHVNEDILKSMLDSCNSEMEKSSVWHNLGDYHYMARNFKAALSCYEEANKIQIPILGTEDHPDVASTINNIGVVFLKQGLIDDALACFQSGLSIRQRVYGLDHEQCSDSLHNIGLAQRHGENYKDAITSYKKSLKIRRIQFGKNKNLKMADTLYNLAIVYVFLEKYDIAFEKHKQALVAYRKRALTTKLVPLSNTLEWLQYLGQKV